MFDISWTEFLLIGVVALIVIGPKELPGVLRTLGQYTRKVRSMAADFQNQFQEAMREAEMTDLKKQVDDLAQDFTHFDPLKDVRKDVEATGQEIEQSLRGTPEPKAASAANEPADAQAPAAASEPAALPAAEPAVPLELVEFHDMAPMETVDATAANSAPQSAEQSAESPDSAGRSG